MADQDAASEFRGVLERDDVLVTIGSGKKAHVFRPRPGANMKTLQLRDDASAYDIAVCGARGEMVQAPDDAEACATCSRVLTED